MIRFCACVLLLGFTSLPVWASDWHRYVNPRYGAAADIPAGFSLEADANVAGEGKVFRAGNGRARITVWGGPSRTSGFMSEIGGHIAAQEAEGWSITYRSETPDWAAWGGTRAGHVFYAKSILTCSGSQTANVRLDYPAADIGTFDVLVTRLGQSLAQDGACY